MSIVGGCPAKVLKYRNIELYNKAKMAGCNIKVILHPA